MVVVNEVVVPCGDWLQKAAVNVTASETGLEHPLPFLTTSV
jgi:hypothetical protein